MPLAMPTTAQPVAKGSSTTTRNQTDPTRGPLPRIPGGSTNPNPATPSNPFGQPTPPVAPPWPVAAPGMPYSVPIGQNPGVVSQSSHTTAAERYAQQMQAYLNAQLGLQGQGYANQINQLSWQRDMAGVGYGQDRRALSEQHFFDRAGLGEQRYRDVDLQRWMNEADLRTANRRYSTATDVADARFANRNDELGRALGLAGDQRDLTVRDLETRFGVEQDQLGADRGLLDQRGGFNDRNIRLQMEQAALRSDSANRAATSDAIARGAGTSGGLSDTRDELARQLDLDFRGARLGYDTEAASIGRAREQIGFDDRLSRNRLSTGRAGANLAYQGARDDYDIGRQGAFIDRSQTVRNADDTLYDAQNNHAYRRDFLNSLGRDYGLRADEMDAALRRGMDRLDLDYGQLLGKLNDAIAGADASRAAAGQALLQQILLAAQG